MGALVRGGVAVDAERVASTLRKLLIESRNGEPEALMAAPIPRTERISTKDDGTIKRDFLIKIGGATLRELFYLLDKHANPPQPQLRPVG